MNARLIKLWNDLQSSYYFIPSLMALGAVILAFVTGYIDRVYDYKVAEHIGWFYSSRPDGARAILTTIAGSMMTIASVSFSITMVAVTTAAGQYGPRLIGNFMRDRANQITLGTFTATFIYCLLILRLSKEGKNGAEDIVEHVPNFSLLVAMTLALASVAVLIYFVHHIPETLNVGNITGRVGRKLRSALGDVFPKTVGEETDFDDDSRIQALGDMESYKVCSSAEGYVQALNDTRLLNIAVNNDVVLKLLSRPGDFVIKGEPLVEVYSGQDVSEETEKAIRDSYAMGLERTEYQNVMFLVDELIEILARALSPGINDPFTAINCLHWYKSALNAAMKGQLPSSCRYDSDENLRVIVKPISITELTDRLCGGSLPYISGDLNVMKEMIAILNTLIDDAESDEHKACLKRHLEAYEKAEKRFQKRLEA